ncbi:MAG: amino acid ABC transporter substrate-binding protein [Chloroflexi bacterium]|nr:MAG: amino acid ABC transporter substrate-binding protein [Chloroflexota bacterium]
MGTSGRVSGNGRQRARWGCLAGLGLALAAVALWLLLRALPEAVDPTWERVVESGVLPVCTDPSWPPFESVEEGTGEIQGFDVDLARLLAAHLAPGVRARIVTVGFDGLYDALLAGRCDAVLSALPYEPLRTQDVAFSLAYFNAGLVMVTAEGAGEVATPADLVGRAVAAEWGFVPEGDSRQRALLQGLGLRRYDTAPAALRALQAGEVEVALVDRIAALGYMRDCQGLRIAGEPLADVNYVIPVRPDSFRLLSEINRVLLEMREGGTLEMLQERWF